MSLTNATNRHVKTVVYVASPYTIKGHGGHATAEQLEERFKEVTKFIAAQMMEMYEEVLFYGPITHSHPISKYMPKSMNTYEVWVQEVDDYWLSICDELWVFCLEGWLDSKGVTHERNVALKNEMTIRYFSPKDYKEIPYAEAFQFN